MITKYIARCWEFVTRWADTAGYVIVILALIYYIGNYT